MNNIDPLEIYAKVLPPSIVALLKAAQAIEKDAEVIGLAGYTNHPAVRVEVRGLCLGHWYKLTEALAELDLLDPDKKKI